MKFLRSLLGASLLATLLIMPVQAAKPVPVVSSISLDQTGPFSIGDPVTFTTTVEKLKGNEYPLIYLRCVQDGVVVYGQLDLPDTVFILGGGSSPWLLVGGTATCTGLLYTYTNPLGGNDKITLLAETAPFIAN